QQLVSLPVIFSFVFTPPPPPRSTLFPYTTLFRSGLGRQTLHLHEVLLLLLETRMGDTVLQPAVVGEQQQPLAVVVQPPGRIHVGYVDAVLQRELVALRAELGQHPEGFIEEDEHEERNDCSSRQRLS